MFASPDDCVSLLSGGGVNIGGTSLRAFFKGGGVNKGGVTVFIAGGMKDGGRSEAEFKSSGVEPGGAFGLNGRVG